MKCQEVLVLLFVTCGAFAATLMPIIDEEREALLSKQGNNSAAFSTGTPTTSNMYATSVMNTTARPTKRSHEHHRFDLMSEDGKMNTDASTDDWDYAENLQSGSIDLEWILLQERRRHAFDHTTTSAPIRATTNRHAPHRNHGHIQNHDQAHKTGHPPGWRHGTPYNIMRHFSLPVSWDQYCKDAEKEEEEVTMVNDGSFHPRYEQVAGVGVFRLHARARSWANARRLCELEGAQLAVPNSAQEAQALAQMHNRCPRLLNSHFNDYIWIGLHDQYSEGHWETVVGHPLNETGFVNWGRNQPDNAHHEGEDCLAMNRNTRFNDVPCWVELPFICEHP